METKTLSKDALDVIEGYKSFRVGDAVAPIPYFNNKIAGTRFGERGRVGKGSPRDISDELDIIFHHNRVDKGALTSEVLAKALCDNGLGIDCSAFAYYILDAESRARGFGSLNKRLTFINGGNPVAKMLSYLHPVKNCDVRTLASDVNSRVVPLSDAKPGDMVTMIGGTDGPNRNHILVIHEAVYEDGVPKRLAYSHSIAYPEDGRYGTGVKQGRIDIAYPSQSILDQAWSESGSFEKAARIHERAKTSQTELRRLKWLS